MLKIFTNGCFDLLHIGHIEILKTIKELYPDSYLYVGLNSDYSVFALKGINRPIFSENVRKEMLLAIKYVDEVIIFKEPTPIDLITKLKPDVIVKGEDYYKNEVVGYNIVNKAITLIKFNTEISTSSLIKRIKTM